MTAPRGPVDPRLLRHARPARAGIAGLAVLGAGQAAATVLLLGALTLAVARPGPVVVPLLALAYVLRAVLTWAEQVVAQRTAASVTGHLRTRLLETALRRGPAWLAGYGSGRLTAVLTHGLDALRPWFGGYLPALVLGVVLPPLVIVVMAVADPASAVIAALTVPLLPVLGALIGWATQARAQQRWAADARLAGHFLDVVRGLATLRVFGRARRQTAVVESMSERHRHATMRVLRVAFLSGTALELVGTLSVGLIAVEAGLRVAAGRLDLGTALLVILLAPEVYRPLREMAARYHAAADATAVVSDVDEVLASPGPVAPSSPVVPAGAAVFARSVRARYPGEAAEALVLPDLDVRPGEIVALRGMSGAGKTTALRVLAGLQVPDSGVAEVTGSRPLYLPQRPTLPHARSVRDVVAGPEALRRTGLDAELSLDTPLGELGHGVSAGQRQRLALAAVLEKALDPAADPPVLLLDEPTAHLDPDSEQRVIGCLREAAARGSAVLVVAHRPALIAAADRVVEIARPRALNGPAAPEVPVALEGPVAPERPAAAAPAAAARSPETAVAAGRKGRPWIAAAALGAAGWLAGLVLTGAAAWLLVRASSRPPVLTLSTAVVLVRGAAVARPLLGYLERLVGHDVALARLGALRAGVYAALIPLVPGGRQRRRGDLLGRVSDDADAVVDGVLRGRIPTVAAWGAAGVASAVAVAIGPAVAVPVVAGLLVAVVIAPALAIRAAIRQEAATTEARTRLTDALVESVDGLEELAARADGSVVARQRIADLAAAERRTAHLAGSAAAAGRLGWGVAVTGAALMLPGAGPGAEWPAVVLLALVALAEPLAVLPEAALAQRRATAAARRLSELDTAPPAGDGQGTATRGGDVEVRGLVAGWDPARPALDGFDLIVPRGETAVLRAPSGAGKSTLAAVLSGFLEPLAGTVRGAGRTVWIGDETGHVFASTVRENLRLARPEASDGELRAVLRRVGLGDWGKDLDTWLGAGGATMSGGQRRRFATARGLLAEPDLLILDEPTEGIDEAGAAALMDDLLGAADGRTTLVLTHRLDGQAVRLREPVTIGSRSVPGRGGENR